MNISEEKKQPLSASPVIVQSYKYRWMIWLLPLIAFVIGILMILQNWISSGPEITISFQTAAGLEAGKTEIKYKDIRVGVIKSIQLSDDGQHIIATVTLNQNAKNLATQGTRFWVVRPRLKIGGITGIDTLLSGVYIAADQGNSTQEKKQFVGLESPPEVIQSMSGRTFTVRTEDLGSLDIGSPVYFKRVQVGRISSYKLKDNGEYIDLQVFIDAPYDQLITPNTRFWNASGVDLSVNANGFHFKTETLAAVMAGGISFSTPVSKKMVNENTLHNHIFLLAKDQQMALSEKDTSSVTFILKFEQSLHGLSVDAPVIFSSIQVGRVTNIALDYNPSGYRFPTIVTIEVYPNRMGKVLEKLPPSSSDMQHSIALFTQDLVNHGLRAKAATSNMLTGQLYIALDFNKQASPVAFDTTQQPLILPTVYASFDQMQDQIASIVSKINNMPLESIGNNLNQTLNNANTSLTAFNQHIIPEIQALMQQLTTTSAHMNQFIGEDAPFAIRTEQTMQEVQRTMRSVRNLTEMLENNPESLLQGKPRAPLYLEDKNASSFPSSKAP